MNLLSGVMYADKPGDTIPFFHWNFFHLLVWFGALHFPDAHSIDLGSVIDGLFSSNVTVVASNNREGWGVESVCCGSGGDGKDGTAGAWQSGLTSILFCVGVRLLTVHQLALLSAHKLPGPNHQGRVSATYREQHRVVVQPSHVGDMCTVSHILLELRMLALWNQKLTITPCWSLIIPVSVLFHPCYSLEWLLLDTNETVYLCSIFFLHFFGT